MAVRMVGTDTEGVCWTGIRRGNHIDWESDTGLSGTETVRDNHDGTLTGLSSTGDVSPCDHTQDGWDGRGVVPDGTYESIEDDDDDDDDDDDNDDDDDDDD